MASTTRLPEALLLACVASLALLLFFSLYSFLTPMPNPSQLPSSSRSSSSASSQFHVKTFYDDPVYNYTISSHPADWDFRRAHWLTHHPSSGVPLFMLSGSQANPCRNPIGDHILLRSLKNKADYCRLHDIPFFYNMNLLHPTMRSFWAKIPLVRAAMMAHPEAEWFWWVDSDAIFTDMEFKLPLEKYHSHNFVVHGWPGIIFENKSWVGLNAGVFLIRNCQWSLDFMQAWASMGPQTPEFFAWGKRLKAEFKDKVWEESDDQSALVHMLIHDKAHCKDKIYIESDYYFEGYWLEIVGRFESIAEKYLEIERRSPELRRRKAEKVAAEENGKIRERWLTRERAENGRDWWRRPFLTHFTGCQPCSGKHSAKYSDEKCWDGMMRALNFADDQVLRAYGFQHEALVGNRSTNVRPLPFDFPASG